MKIVPSAKALKQLDKALIGYTLDPEFPDEETLDNAAFGLFSQRESDEIERLMRANSGRGKKAILWDLLFDCRDSWLGKGPRTKYLARMKDQLAKLGVDLVVALPEPPPKRARKAPQPRAASSTAGLALAEAKGVPFREPAPKKSPKDTPWEDASALPGWRIGEQPALQPSSRAQLWVQRAGGKVAKAPIDVSWFLSVDLSADGAHLLVVDGYAEALIEYDLATGAASTLEQNEHIFQAAYVGADRIAMLASDAKHLTLFARSDAGLKKLARVAPPKSGKYRVIQWAHGGRVLVLPGNRDALVVGAAGDELAILGKAAYPSKHGPLASSSEASRRSDGRIYIELVHGKTKHVVYELRGVAEAYQARFGEAL